MIKTHSLNLKRWWPLTYKTCVRCIHLFRWETGLKFHVLVVTSSGVKDKEVYICKKCSSDPSLSDFVKGFILSGRLMSKKILGDSLEQISLLQAKRRSSKIDPEEESDREGSSPEKPH